VADDATVLTFLNVGHPTGLKFTLEHRGRRALFELGLEHSPGAMPFSLGLRPRPHRELADLLAAGMAPRDSGVLGRWDGVTEVFLSHLHLDHTSLVRFVPPEVPVHYPAAMEELRRDCVASGHLRWRDPPGNPVPEGGVVRLDGIEVRFVAVDHDLPGACGFLVTTPELRLAYTGDHRWHGRHPELTAAFARAARGVDVLVLEAVGLGTLGEDGGDSRPEVHELDEAQVEEEFGRVLSRTRGLALVNLYPMNRERVAALAAVCAAQGRHFLMEEEAAAMAGWSGCWDEGTLAQARREPSRFCLQLGFASLPCLIDLEPPPGSVYVHSNGIPLGDFDPTFAVVRAWVESFGLELAVVGTSGHSRPADLVRMVEMVRPRLVIPVHSRRPWALRVPVPVLVPEARRPYAAPELLV
jgi:ribonuclease J